MSQTQRTVLKTEVLKKPTSGYQNTCIKIYKYNKTLTAAGTDCDRELNMKGNRSTSKTPSLHFWDFTQEVQIQESLQRKIQEHESKTDTTDPEEVKMTEEKKNTAGRERN